MNRKRVSRATFYSFTLAFALVTACLPTGEFSQDDLQIDLTEFNSGAIEIEAVIEAVTDVVNTHLPGARLGAFSFAGPCQSFTSLRGELYLSYTRSRWTILGQRIHVAIARIDTTSGLMRLSIRDDTEFYPDTEPLSLTGKSIEEIAGIVRDFLQWSNECDKEIMFVRVKTDGPWRVRCGPREETFLECIEVDPETGRVSYILR